MINNKDTRETITVEMTDEEFLTIAKAAHNLDITFNEFVENALVLALEKFELEHKA